MEVPQPLMVNNTFLFQYDVDEFTLCLLCIQYLKYLYVAYFFIGMACLPKILTLFPSLPSSAFSLLLL